MSRFRAGGLHFLISFFVALVLLALFWFVWYPAPMLTAIGGREIFLLIVGIDVVLGPLLTTIVFKSGKKTLKFDLTVIGVVQVAALAYGLTTLLQARPIFVAALGDKFQVVQAGEITDSNLAKTKTSLPWWGPRWVGTKEPLDLNDISELDLLETVGGGRGQLPQLHIPYESMTQEILHRSQPIAELKKHNVAQASDIDSWLQRYGYAENDAKFQPIWIGASKFVVMIDAKNGAIIGIAPFKSESFIK